MVGSVWRAPYVVRLSVARLLVGLAQAGGQGMELICTIIFYSNDYRPDSPEGETMVVLYTAMSTDCFNSHHSIGCLTCVSFY